MKLFGAAMLRNEADVVESFVRHNLSLLDGLLVVARAFADTADAVIAVGNHVVLPSAGHSIAEQPVRHARIAAEVVALAHLPVRSARQLTNKIVIGWLAHCAARRSNADL